MALSIKDEATGRLVRRYAALRGTTYTDAIRQAVGEAMRREGQAVDEPNSDGRAFLKLVRKLQREIAAAPVLDDRPYREILYDEDGLPK